MAKGDGRATPIAPRTKSEWAAARGAPKKVLLGGVVDEGGPVVRFRRVVVGDRVVTLGQIRLWMASVPTYGGREGSDRWWRYVQNYGVPSKVARQLDAGTFYRTVLSGLMSQGRCDARTIRFVKRAARDFR